MIVNVQATSFISIAYVLMLIQFYPFGYSQNDNSLRVENDAVSDGIDLSGYFIFNDEWISRIYVRVCIYACYSDIHKINRHTVCACVHHTIHYIVVL